MTSAPKVSKATSRPVKAHTTKVRSLCMLLAAGGHVGNARTHHQRGVGRDTDLMLNGLEEIYLGVTPDSHLGTSTETNPIYAVFVHLIDGLVVLDQLNTCLQVSVHKGDAERSFQEGLLSDLLEFGGVHDGNGLNDDVQHEAAQNGGDDHGGREGEDEHNEGHYMSLSTPCGSMLEGVFPLLNHHPMMVA